MVGKSFFFFLRCFQSSCAWLKTTFKLPPSSLPISISISFPVHIKRNVCVCVCTRNYSEKQTKVFLSETKSLNCKQTLFETIDQSIAIARSNWKKHIQSDTSKEVETLCFCLGVFYSVFPYVSIGKKDLNSFYHAISEFKSSNKRRRIGPMFVCMNGWGEKRG